MFGGYTNIPWTDHRGWVKNRSESFVFSVRADEKVVKLEHHKGFYEVRHDKRYSMDFGNSFEVRFEGKQDKSVVYELGGTYLKPKDIEKSSMQAKYYLTKGKIDYKVDTIEVFKVVMPPEKNASEIGVANKTKRK